MFVIADFPSEDCEMIWIMDVVFSANLEDFLHSFRRLMRGGMALESGISGGCCCCWEVRRLWRAVTESTRP